MTAISGAQGFAPLPSPFRLRHGSELVGGRIAFESWGDLSPQRDNAILLFTGLSASAHARSAAYDPSPGWWEYMIGPGAALDTNRYQIICVNSLGSCFGSTGPLTENPLTGNPYGNDFPQLALEDIAHGGKAVLEHLGIEHAYCVLGASLGGMVALAYVALFPDGARSIASISATMAASPYAIALRSIQREAVTSDPYWRGGRYSADSPPRTGLTLARKIGTVTYRSSQEFLTRFARNPAVDKRDFAVEDYLAEQAQRFVDRFDANSYLRLSRAMDLFDLTVHGKPVEVFQRSALESALIVGVDFDHLFTLEEQDAIAEALAKAGIATTFEELHSLAGHDAFLADQILFSKVISSWFNLQHATEKSNVAIHHR